MWIRASLLLIGGLAGPALAQDGAVEPEAPLPELVAPDWLSDTVIRPHANIAQSATVPTFEIMPIGTTQLDGVGVLPGSVTGLPRGLWGASDTETLARLFGAQPIDGLPAIQAFTETLALAELDPPVGAPIDSNALFLSRVDMLLARGALDPAQALIERGGPMDPEVFRRWFDISLLTDHVSRACATMDANPDIAPTFPARIFCLARSGDWSAAALSLGTGAALNRISEDEADLIARFLDPELFEGEPPLAPDPDPTPLTFQMRVALGERPDVRSLPLAFAHADLSNIAGWRAQLDAVERLTRAGAIEATQWLAIYTDRDPSASGGVWDRVEALQAFDIAILAGDTAEVSRRLPAAIAAMEQAGLLIAFAEVYADLLVRLPLTGNAALQARRIGLLSPIYERVATSTTPQTGTERFAFDIARGLPTTAPPGSGRQDQAIAAAFTEPLPDHRYMDFVRDDRLGEALLRAALVLSRQAPDSDDLTDALVLYRDVGLEDVARRAALQLILGG
ncbi:MAG: hypothetical protein AAF376_13415 [Pseudomonadota bacterium]